ncbi:MAG: DUF4349 domain-containing protein [Kiritimatiellaeota bacterium]|nr:DUF4349 domain-containing protein [Kiritimatiellota bacterium]
MKIKFLLPLLTLALAAQLFSGCASVVSYSKAPCIMKLGGGDGTAEAKSSEVRADRMLIWKAWLEVEVWNVSNAVAQATALAQLQGGFVDQTSGGDETSARLRLRVPASTLKAAVGALEELGTVTRRNIESEDVTEQYVDVEARLKNKLVLRDRLKQLLDKATGVKDVLAIETELNRVQADIDSMTARLKTLKGQADLATIEVSFTRKAILGPLGYVCHGLWWCVEKLFVIRD